MKSLYEVGKQYLGQDISRTQNDLGCIESLSFVLAKAGLPVKENLSTIRLDKELSQDIRFIQIKKPEVGCIILSPTQGGDIGHGGIMSIKNRIMSNNSRNSLWSQHLNLFMWIWKYRKLETKYYRPRTKEETEKILKSTIVRLQENLVVLLQKLLKIYKEKMANRNLGALASSADSTKIAMTFKGLAVALIPIIIIIGGAFGFEIVKTDLVEIVKNITIIISTTITCLGLIRKVFYRYSNQNK